MLLIKNHIYKKNIKSYINLVDERLESIEW